MNHAIQGDDFYYLKGAEHALIDPLHPTHAKYVLAGHEVDMRGHPHPPLNAWVLAGLIAILHDEPEVPLHAFYILFSVVAALSALTLCRKFSKRPLLAVFLFLATPAFVVNGNSLESDLPFLAFWLAAIALFVHDRWWLAAVASALAALAASQAVVLAAVFAWWLILKRDWRIAAWIPVFAAPFTIGAYQLFEFFTSGSLPASVLAGYMQSYNLQAFTAKVKSAAALTGHIGWLVFPALAALAFWRSRMWVRASAAAVMAAAAIADHNPLFWISCGIGALTIFWCVSQIRSELPTSFLSGWVAIFFATALVIFFAGSARYLLPIAVPVAILIANRVANRWLCVGIAASLAISLGLAIVNAQHWNSYREFARGIAPEMQRHRTWTTAEWGLRHYLERAGAMPAVEGRAFRPGDLIITTDYEPTPHIGPSAVIAERDICSSLPLRLVAPGVDSAYSSVAFGLAPFGISQKPMDHVRALLIAERKAELSTLDIGTPSAAPQIISGIYNNDRWTSDRATVLLKRPAEAARLEAKIFIPPQAPARTIRLLANGRQLAEQTFAAPGAYTLSAEAPRDSPITASIEVDRTFSVPPDIRRLGVVLISIGFR